jgi:hypothetical protein
MNENRFAPLFDLKEVNRAIMMLLTTGRNVEQAGIEVRNICALLHARQMARNRSLSDSLRALRSETEMHAPDAAQYEYLANIFGVENLGAAHFLITNVDNFNAFDQSREVP